MPEKNVVSWNAMVTGFLSNGDVRRAAVLCLLGLLCWVDSE